MPHNSHTSNLSNGIVCRMAFAAVLAVLLLFALSSVAYGASSFYWYGNGDSTCWQTGELGSPSEACDSVGAGHLATPGSHTGGLEYMSEGGSSTNLTQLSSSGDYCSYARLGSELKYQDSTNEGAISGLSMPTPYSSYQEGDKTANAYNACQADGAYWGQAVRGPSGKGCAGEACGIGHYVSLRSQGSNDRPWGNGFGEPSLVLSVEAGVSTFNASGSSYGGWGYVCPELEDTEPSFHGVIEYCLQEWRSAHDAPQWKNERVQECASPSSQINTYFWPGTSYATEMPGSTSTFEVGSAGSGHFEAKITQTNLIKAVQLINATCSGWHLSENPANYALVGVENGLEGYYGVSAMGGWGANLQLHTEYTEYNSPSRPAAIELPNGQQHVYYHATNNELGEWWYNNVNQPGKWIWSFYEHGGPAAGNPFTIVRSSGNQEVFFRGTDGAIHEWWWNQSTGTWAPYNLGGEPGGDPTGFVNESTGQVFVYFRARGGGIGELWYNNINNPGHWIWSYYNLGGSAAGDVLALQRQNGNQEIYYRGTDGGMHEWWWNHSNGEWAQYSLGGEVGGDPSGFENETTGQTFIYFRARNGGVGELWYNNINNPGHWIWSYYNLGGSAAGDVLALQRQNGNQEIYFPSTDGGMHEWWWNHSNGEWAQYSLGGEVGGDPSGFENETTGQTFIFYRARNGGIGELWYNNINDPGHWIWSYYNLGGSVAP